MVGPQLPKLVPDLGSHHCRTGGRNVPTHLIDDVDTCRVLHWRRGVLTASQAHNVGLVLVAGSGCTMPVLGWSPPPSGYVSLESQKHDHEKSAIDCRRFISWTQTARNQGRLSRYRRRPVVEALLSGCERLLVPASDSPTKPRQESHLNLPPATS